jgi:hypothetical protein
MVAAGWWGWDWGNVPSWIGSVLTGTSLFIAAVTYLRHVKDQAREQQARERQQAGRVSAWVVGSRRALIRNGNEVAVTVHAYLDLPGLFAASDPVTCAPGGSCELTLPYEYERHVGEPGRGRPTPVLVIVDSSGRPWLRTDRGELRLLSGSERDELDRRLAGATTRMALECAGG